MKNITALVLAAGLSHRMGQPKLILPWGDRTIIESVVSALLAGGVEDILIITGGSQAEVGRALESYPVCLVHNPLYQNGEMLDSMKAGLEAMPESAAAALVALGDQPQIQEDTVRQVVTIWQAHPERIVMPSYAMRRGHPWALPRPFWSEILALSAPRTMRDFHNAHSADILYVNVDTPTILADIDTPDDYRQSGMGSGYHP